MNTVQDFNFTPKAKRALDVAKQRCVENNQLEINDEFLFEHVIKNTCKLATDEQLMFVVGATKPQDFTIIRKHAPSHFLLVPGVGAQGGSLAEVVKYGKTDEIGLLINFSKSFANNL